MTEDKTAHTLLHTHTHSHIHTYTHTYIYTHTTHTHTHTRTHIHTYTYTHTYIRIHTYTHTHIHTHTYTHTHIHTHTHMNDVSIYNRSTQDQGCCALFLRGIFYFAPLDLNLKFHRFIAKMILFSTIGHTYVCVMCVM